jgi:N-acetylglutamate synthase-like GNAT family acetyltransferase
VTAKEIKIRLATPTDAGRIIELCIQLGYKVVRENVRERIQRIMNKGDTVAFVAEEDGFVNGWIQATIKTTIESGEFAEIMGLVVDESARGKGIGKSLVRKAEEWARKSGQKSIRVRTNVVRVQTHDFYRNLGFEETKKQVVFEKGL